MNPAPYLFFNGNCEEAIRTYAEIFNAPPPEITRFSDMPPGEMDLPPGAEKAVMHATIKLGDGTIMASDDVMGNAPAMAGCNVMVSLPTNDEGRAAFDRLAEGGEVRMPYEPSFWAKGFGALTDRFGIRWMISTDEAP